MFGLASLLSTPILGGLAVVLGLGLGATALHTWGVPFLGLQGISGKLSFAESARDSCLKDINDPATGWAVRFKTVQNNETVLKTTLEAQNKSVVDLKTTSDQRDAEARQALAVVRGDNTRLNARIRLIQAQQPTRDGVAKQAVEIVLGSLR